MFGLIESIKEITEDLVDIATAPIEIIVDTARLTTKPLADMSKGIAKEIKESTKET